MVVRSVPLRSGVLGRSARKPETAGAARRTGGTKQENVRGAAAIYRHAAKSAAGPVTEELVDADGGRSLVRREPAGVAALIVPWNSP
jgi:acyl-CoA reductase-like NAD-dependent aldehyde dehydrogenase